jgi:hypothetical protein
MGECRRMLQYESVPRCHVVAGSSGELSEDLM